MAASKQALVYCWISIVFMSPVICNNGTEDSEHQLYSYDSIFENIHDGVAYDFVQEFMSWAQARRSCENRGGHLLRELNEEIVEFLQTLSEGSGPWWVDQHLMSQDSVSGDGVQSQDHPVCTYLVSTPFHLETTPNCSLAIGSLCTLDTNTHRTSSDGKSRQRRDISTTLSALSTVSTVSALLTNVKSILKDLETSTYTMTKADRILYLQSILNFVKTTTLTDPVQMDEVINATAAMLLYTQECELESMDDFEQLISLAGLIYVTVRGGPVTQELPTGTMFVNSQTPEELGGMTVGSKEGTYCQFPSYSAMSDQLPSGKVNVQLFQFKVNPLLDKSNETITGATCSFSLHGRDSSVKLRDLPENIEIFLPRPEAPDPDVVQIAWKPGYAVTSAFNITDINMTVIITAKPNQNVSLRFQLSPPHEQNSTAVNQSSIVTYKEGYRWLIPPEMRKDAYGNWKVAILPVNYTSSEPLFLNVSVFVTKCLFWDTELDGWSREGCMVGQQTRPSLTHCLCNHTTFFGSSFFVMPNQVDLSQTAALFATVKENYIVVVLMSCFFAVYLAVVMWAWYADRKALRTRKMTLLDDNHPCAQYNYLVNVQTGHRRKAGTTAKVKAIFQFSEGKSEPYNLSDPEKPVCERGGVDVFLLSIPFPLGKLESIEIWHDNSGGSPDWYVDKVMVQDLQTQEVSHFLCSTWLRGETCRRTFNSAKSNEIASFGNIFQTRTSSGFRDEHIWVSIVDPPRRSPFTRVQRVSCCMSLLLCTMAINIMFWNLPTDEESPVILKIGSFALTWQELMVAVESGLFMFPINILIITIFRHIKPRIATNKDGTDTFKNKTAAAASVSMNTITKETHELLTHLSKSQKNMLPKDLKPETSGDIFWTLNKLNDVLDITTGEPVGDPHWSYCSRFVLYSLSHLSVLLEHVGEKGCFLNEELRQARGTLNVLLKKAEMASQKHTSQRPICVQEPQKKKGWWLPWWFLFIGWFLLFVMSGISTFFTLLYGFQYGRESSIQWVITLTLSLVQSIFILQPLKVILVAIFFAMILRPVAVDYNEEVELLLKEQKRKCEEYSGRSIS